jgi:hypothetical protein
MDRRAFGDDRTRLLEVALRHGSKLLVAEGRGFGLLEGKKLGPVVAADCRAALGIVTSASNLGASLIYVPYHPALPTEFLDRLKPQDEEGPITCCTRMSLGEPLEQEPGLVYADYSAATG